MAQQNDELVISTPLTKYFGIKHPIILAGMYKAAGPELAAAVTNAGGIGVIGGLTFTPRILKATINHLKRNLIDKNAPFGVDLAIPKVGGTARKTNYDYTKGKLEELIDIMIECGARLFVCAIGIPPKHIVDKLHKNNILVMNMVGHPKHVEKALSAGVDAICAQGSEGGGHTGSVATSVLLPKIVDLCKKGNYKSPLTGDDIYVVGSGGVYDGRGLAMVLSFGCDAAWVGTRFVASKEALASNKHKNDIVNAGFDDTMTTLVYSGRPLRCVKNDYIVDWQTNRKQEMEQLLAKGIVPVVSDMKAFTSEKKIVSNAAKNSKNPMDYYLGFSLSGQIAANIDQILPAKQIVEEMVRDACKIFKYQASRVQPIQVLSKL